jgi:Flp pilus assembly protein CpaB
MSSALRLSIIAVMLLATSALGLIAYKMTLPNAEPVQAAAPAPPTAAPAPPTPVYFVAKYPLTEGTLVREEYFRSAPMAEAPSGAFRYTPDDMSKLRGSLVRKFIYAGDAITSQNVMLRDDQGFRAALQKLCQDANTRQQTTVTVHANGKVQEYSVQKTDSKASEACAELERGLPMTSPRATM